MVCMFILPASMLQTGELATRPGFQALDFYSEITDHFFPWWNKAYQNPASHFPNTWKFIQEEMEDKGLVKMAEMNTQQLREGIDGTFDEIAKMNLESFKLPMIFTGITFPRRGSDIFLVVVALAQEAGLDIDEVFDDGDNPSDDSLE